MLRLLFLLILAQVFGGPALASSAHSSAPPTIYPWPMEQLRGNQSYSSNFGQYQWLGARYFHAGLDILAVPGQPLWSPVSGKIEGGYYSYKDEAHGHYYLNKTWVPLYTVLENPGPHAVNDFQFEVALITPEGWRLEFHHVDPKTLPQHIVSAILKNETVEAGALLGFVKFLDVTEFGVPYTHIHYNVVSPEGVHLNPQAFAPKVADTTPPKIHMVLAGPLGRCTSGVGDTYKVISPNNPLIDERELLVKASDHMDENSIPQALTKLRAEFVGHPSVELDFSWSLLDHANQPIEVHTVFHKQFCVAAGSDRPFPMLGSTISDFYYRIPIPSGYNGHIKITVGDFAGNETPLEL